MKSQSREKIEDWEKKFDDEFKGQFCCGGDFCEHDEHRKVPDMIKSFIKTLIDEAKAEQIEKVLQIIENERKKNFPYEFENVPEVINLQKRIKALQQSNE